MVLQSFPPPVWRHPPCTSVLGQPEQNATHWVARAETSRLSVLQAASAKSPRSQGYAPSEPCRRGCFLPPCSSWHLPVVLSTWLVEASLPSPPPWSRGRLLPVCLCLWMAFYFSQCFSSLVRTRIILDSSPTLVQHDLILTSLRTLLPKKSHSEGLQHLFWGK